jgi:hypothetical protein
VSKSKSRVPKQPQHRKGHSLASQVESWSFKISVNTEGGIAVRSRGTSTKKGWCIMEKLKLNLEDIRVDSFDTMPDASSRTKGTVVGFDTDTLTDCWVYTCLGGCETGGCTAACTTRPTAPHAETCVGDTVCDRETTCSQSPTMCSTDDTCATVGSQCSPC